MRVRCGSDAPPKDRNRRRTAPRRRPPGSPIRGRAQRPRSFPAPNVPWPRSAHCRGWSVNAAGCCVARCLIEPLSQGGEPCAHVLSRRRKPEATTLQINYKGLTTGCNLPKMIARRAPASQATSSRIAGRHHFGISGRLRRNLQGSRYRSLQSLLTSLPAPPGVIYLSSAAHTPSAAAGARAPAPA
jgi:hypothetical protein